jgi:hypothetical protein
MKAYQDLNEHLAALYELIEFLTPNSIPSDIDRIEANIEQGKLYFEKANKINIFGNLEELLLESTPDITNNFIERILINMEYYIGKWNTYYNKKTFDKAEDFEYLYRNAEQKYLISHSNGLIFNILSEIEHFNENYLNSEIKSKFLISQIDLKNKVKIVFLFDPEKTHRKGYIISTPLNYLEQYIVELLSLEVNIWKEKYMDHIPDLISKFDSIEFEQLICEEIQILDFANFRVFKRNNVERLQDLQVFVADEFSKLNMYKRGKISERLEGIRTNFNNNKFRLMENHIAYREDKISSRDFRVSMEEFLYIPDGSNMFIPEEYIKYLIDIMNYKYDLLMILNNELQSIETYHPDNFKTTEIEPVEKENKRFSLRNSGQSSYQTNLPKNTRTPQYKTFPEYLNLYKNPIKLADALKIEFKGGKGIAIRLMFEGLQMNNCMIITSGEYKAIIESFRNYVNWNIGTYQAIQNHKSNSLDKPELMMAEKRIKLIIQNIEK